MYMIFQSITILLINLKYFIVLLNFSESLARDWTKCLSLNDEACMVWPTLIDLNSLELEYYPFMISLENMCFKKAKGINFKAFNVITNKNEAKTIAKHIPRDWKCKFNSTTCNSNQKWNNKHVNMNVKIMISAKKIIVGILAHIFVRIASIEKILQILQWLHVMKLYLLWTLYQQKWQIL